MSQLCISDNDCNALDSSVRCRNDTMNTRTKRTAPRPLKIAIFDIDGTIFRSSLLIELFNELLRRGVFPETARYDVDRKYIAWLNRKGHYNDYMISVVNIFYDNLAGCSVHKIEPAIRAVIRRQKDRVHRYPRHLIQELRKKGYFIMAISNSPEPMVKRFATMMKFDTAIGHILEVVDDVYTGNSLLNGKKRPGRAWMDKIKILQRFAEESGMNIDLANSVMIGDSEGDLPLLSIVGNPIAFNPSLPLALEARSKGWRIIVERKDVIYDIRDAEIIQLRGQAPHVPYGNRKK